LEIGGLIVHVTDGSSAGSPPGDKKKAEMAVPGKPTYHFY